MSEPQSLMAGKRGLVMGVANDRSIAWGIATAAREQGAELAFTFQGEALERRVRPLAESVGAEMVLPCDVTEDRSEGHTSELQALIRLTNGHLRLEKNNTNQIRKNCTYRATSTQ